MFIGMIVVEDKYQRGWQFATPLEALAFIEKEFRAMPRGDERITAAVIDEAGPRPGFITADEVAGLATAILTEGKPKRVVTCTGLDACFSVAAQTLAEHPHKSKVSVSYTPPFAGELIVDNRLRERRLFADRDRAFDWTKAQFEAAIGGDEKIDGVVTPSDWAFVGLIANAPAEPYQLLVYTQPGVIEIGVVCKDSTECWRAGQQAASRYERARVEVQFDPRELRRAAARPQRPTKKKTTPAKKKKAAARKSPRRRAAAR